MPHPIPDRMKHLKLTASGVAIPYGVVVDKTGRPHFSINDEHIRARSLTKELCSMCGKPLFRGRWLVGGTLSAFHEHGAFIDPPMHSECAHYALQVCPYLAAPRYAKEVGVEKAKSAAFNHELILVDPTMMPGRPAGDLFIALMATKVDVFENLNCKPRKPYSRVEFWRHGKQLSESEGITIVKEHYPELSL